MSPTATWLLSGGTYEELAALSMKLFNTPQVRHSKHWIVNEVDALYI
jgi:hypothetical protein